MARLQVLGKFGVLATVMLAAFAGAGANAAGQPRIAFESLPGVQVQHVALDEAATQNLNLRVVSACAQGAAVFKVFNDGQQWPAAGTFGIYRVAGNHRELVSHRTMRLAAGQQASFRVSKPGEDTFALFVEPGWYQRTFTRDAELVCK